MLFLVQGENIDSGYLVPPEQIWPILEHAVAPSFQILGGMAEQGRLMGGVHPGERAGAFVVDVGSFEELDDVMNHLPFFGLVKWTVKPLVPFATMAQSVPRYVNDLRQQMQGG